MLYGPGTPSTKMLALVSNALLHSEDAANFELPIPIKGHTHFLSPDQHLIFCWDYVMRNYDTIPQQFDASFDELQMYADAYNYLLNKEVFRNLLEGGSFVSYQPSTLFNHAVAVQVWLHTGTDTSPSI